MNQFKFGSSSGIHSLTACHGGSMGSMVPMPKGGGGGAGREDGQTEAKAALRELGANE